MFNAHHKTTGVFTSAQKHFFSSSEISRSGLLQFRDKGQFSDVILDVFGTKITAFKIVLAANSEYFNALFCSPLNESSGEIIYFGDKGEEPDRMDLTRPAILAVVDYLYTGHIHIESDIVVLKDIAKAANYFHLYEIVFWIYDIIQSNVSDVVFCDNYSKMSEMDLMTHLEAKKVSCWEDIRNPESFVVIAGGDAGEREVSLYDPAADMWSPLPVEMPSGWLANKSAVHKSLVYMFGRRLDEEQQQPSSEVLKLDLNMLEEGVIWQENFKEVRHNPTVAETDCYVYLVGGRDKDSCVTSSVERFSVRIDVWGEADPIKARRTGACSAVLGDIIYILGGSDGERVLNTVEMYDNALFITDTDEEKAMAKSKALEKDVASMKVARTGGRAVDHDGLIYVIGGNTGDGHTKTVEVYDPEANEWSLIAEMKFDRREFRLAVVHNRILVVGGYVKDNPTDLVELFDIGTKTWVVCEQLSDPRANFSMSTVKVDFLDPQVVNKIKFRGDVLIEKTRRTTLPVQEHFKWK